MEDLQKKQDEVNAYVEQELGHPSNTKSTKRYEIDVKVEIPEKGWAKSVINKIIWGDNKYFYEK